MSIINGFMNKLGADTYELGEGYIELSTHALTFRGDPGDTTTLTVEKIGDGPIEVTSSNTNICSVSINGTTITCTLQGTGVVTLTATTNSTMHLPASDTCTITCYTVDPVLENNTPDKIKSAAQGGVASLIWNIGDRTAPIAVSAFGSGNAATSNMRAFIIGFDHHANIEGSGITFQMGVHSANATKRLAFVDSLYGSLNTSTSTYKYFRMTRDTGNEGGWNSCYIRKYIVPAFMSALPAAWQNVIRTDVCKYTLNSGGRSAVASYVTATTDSAFLLAVYEVFGSCYYTQQYESIHQRQYAYYANGNNKTMYQSSASTTACSWWLRSPVSSTATAGSKYYYYVTSTGTAASTYGYYCMGFSPAFVVGANIEA